MHAPTTFMPIGRNTSIEELFEAAAIELDELRRRDSITLQLRPLQAWALLGNLQLALAHERNKGATTRRDAAAVRISSTAHILRPSIQFTGAVALACQAEVHGSRRPNGGSHWSTDAGRLPHNRSGTGVAFLRCLRFRLNGSPNRNP